MTQTTLILIHGSLSVTLLLMLWGLQYYRNNAGVVDVGWALVFMFCFPRGQSNGGSCSLWWPSRGVSGCSGTF